MQVLSYILSTLGLISMLVASAVKGKRMKLILFLAFCGNLFVATSYHIGGSGINGAAACYLGAVMTIINYFFESKDIPLPKWLISIYAICMVALNLWVAGGLSLFSGIAIIASLVYILAIIQKSGAGYRFWTIINMILWCTYDIITGSYSVLITHVPQLVTALVSAFFHDRKGKQNVNV
ncbi:MAG: YgjV family protein [Clostridia bacterium]|nr:YgjV family protein [Clostridia bacterium]